MEASITFQDGGGRPSRLLGPLPPRPCLGLPLPAGPSRSPCPTTPRGRRRGGRSAPPERWPENPAAAWPAALQGGGPAAEEEEGPGRLATGPGRGLQLGKLRDLRDLRERARERERRGEEEEPRARARPPTRHGGGPGVGGRGGAGPGVRGRRGRGAGLVPGRGGRGPGAGAAGARGPQHGRRAGGAARGHRGGPGGGRGAVRAGRAGVQPRAGVPGLREEVRREHGAVQRLRGEPGGGAGVQVGEPLRRVRARGRAGALRRAANIGACAP